MNNLTVIERNGRIGIDSRDVAEMIDKQHGHLLRDIAGYIEILTQSNFGFSEFFVPSNYQDSTGRTLPCYLITKKGCDMVANKMTGEKGVLFTAAYVTKFEEMERATKFDYSKLSPQLALAHQMLESMAKLELQQHEISKELTNVVGTVQNIKETIIQRDDNWRESINRMINKVAQATGKGYDQVRVDSYIMLEERGGCDLIRRVKNLRERMFEAGETKTAINKANRLDVIETDKRLKEIYTQIVKEMTIAHVS
jgi:Rha family phage regulatory protein